MAWTNISNGTKPDADEVMGNFDLVRYRIFDSTTSATSTQSTTEATLTTLSVGAGECTTLVKIDIDYDCVSFVTGGGDSTIGRLHIYIGETGSTVLKKTFKPYGSGQNSSGGQFQGTYIYTYLPTSDEKTNGFDIEIKGQVANSGTTGGDAGYNSVYVYGI